MFNAMKLSILPPYSRKTSIRVYFNSMDSYIQLPGILADSENNDITIGEYLLNHICPQLLEKDPNTAEITKKRPCKILLHGIECALDTPLYWLHLNMAYIDNFIYIVVISDK